MRLIRVHIHNYKRLVDTGFWVTGKSIAVVGPNEAGKSSLIRALRLMDPEEGVSQSARNRDSLEEQPDIVDMVSCRFILQHADLALLEHLPIAVPPTEVTVTRRSDGTIYWSTPTDLKLSTASKTRVRDLLKSLTQAYLHAPPPESNDMVDPHDFDDLLELGRLLAADKGDTDYSEFDFERVIELVSELEESGDANVSKAAKTFRTAIRSFGWYALNGRLMDGVVSALGKALPRFVEFDESRRILNSDYHIPSLADDPDDDRPVHSLLAIGGYTAPQLHAVLGDVGRRQTLLERLNGKLATFFQARWSQAGVSPRFLIEGDRLQLLVHERETDGSLWSIADRSAGLKLYLALVAFLHDSGVTDGTVLLIDEAEEHLHYDAQANLIDVLTDEAFLGKVIYTTHSPGCLPRDLGTGVRFVQPDPDDAARSRIRHDFWAEPGGGFTPLLMVMGASAATFAHVRKAVLAEGPTEMLILPSLIRAATGSAELPYQVAPGLASYPSANFGALDDVAASICFLVDGDGGGKEWAKQLSKTPSFVPKIVRLPEDQAIEDLLPRDLYFEALCRAGVDAALLPALDAELAEPVKVAISELVGKMPGTVNVAQQLLNIISEDPNRLVLSEKQRAFLSGLHQEFCVILDVPPSKR